MKLNRCYYENIVSCYRTPNDVYISCGTKLSMTSLRDDLASQLFFPLWILPALIPTDHYKFLYISSVTVAHFSGHSVEPYIDDAIKAIVDKLNGRLVIRELIVVCDIGKEDDVMLIAEEFLSNFDEFINYNLTINHFDEEITCIEDTAHESPHTMFGSCGGISDFFQPPPAIYHSSLTDGSDRILIATLGYGYNPSPFLDGIINEMTIFATRTFPAIKIDKQSLVPGRTADFVYDHWLTHSWIVHEYTAQSSFVVVRTTDENGIIVNGATAKAIEWLRNIWDKNKKIKENYDNLIILIPYGGQYMEDEMIQITKATDEGIIVVCAAGDCKEEKGVVFPAALGSVISVGVAGNGPKGREVDVSVDFTSRPATLPGIKDVVHLPEDCGIAAARITGLLSLLLARINTVCKLGNNDHSIIKYIRGDMDKGKDKDEGDDKKRKRRNRYMHICVIRELLVNEGSGRHDPQLGYGNGEEIITSLLMMEDNTLLQRLYNVVLGNPDIALKGDSNVAVKYKPVNESNREKLFCGLDGKDITVAIIDQYICIKEIKPNITTFMGFGPLHGYQCAAVLQTVCPESDILCVNTESDKAKDIHSSFSECLNLPGKLTDIISCSLASPCFDYDLCKAVNDAVRAGKIIVFAAGNEGPTRSNTILYPGRQGNILVIGGRDRYYSRVGFSSVGREIDFLAEAEQFLKSAGSLRGTSFAAPVVAGYIALLLQFIKKEMTGETVEVWSQDKWDTKSVFVAAHNVHAMRELLKLLVVKPQEHTEKEGYGCLDFATLFPQYNVPTKIASDAKRFVIDEAKKKIRNKLQYFYKQH